MLKCKHCKKLFKEGFGKGSLKTHQAAVKAAAKKKSTSKSNKNATLKIDHQEVKVCPKCKKLVVVSKLKKHIKSHKTAKIASQRNIESEKQYVRKLKKQKPRALLFQTGKEVGVPDIVMYEDSKLTFYEIKPTKQENDNNSRLKDTQVAWIKKNCLGKKNRSIHSFLQRPNSKNDIYKKTTN